MVIWSLVGSKMTERWLNMCICLLKWKKHVDTEENIPVVDLLRLFSLFSLFLSYISSHLPPDLHLSTLTLSLSPSLFLSVALAVVINELTGDLSRSVELFLPLRFILLCVFSSFLSLCLTHTPTLCIFYLFLFDSSVSFTYFVFLFLFYLIKTV